MLVGVVSFFYGVAYTIAPFFVVGLYVDTPNAEAALTGRFFGLTLLFVGVACWLIRDTVDLVAKNAIVLAGIVNGLVGFVTSLYFTLNGGLTPFGWSAVLIYLVFGIGWFLVLGKVKRGAA